MNAEDRFLRQLPQWITVAIATKKWCSVQHTQRWWIWRWRNDIL